MPRRVFFVAVALAVPSAGPADGPRPVGAQGKVGCLANPKKVDRLLIKIVPRTGYGEELRTPRIAAPVTPAAHHIESFIQLRDEPRDLCRVVLEIAIH